MTTRESPPAELLQTRLHALNDLHLTIKHAHWNVLGSNFIAVHEMLDTHAEAVRAMTDEIAERIATLGTVASGTPGALVAARTWMDYGVGRADALTHLRALDPVYTRVIEGTRIAAAAVGGPDPATEDVLIGQLRELERLQWFVRAHIGDADQGRPA